MKKISIMLLLLCSFTVAYAQDTVALKSKVPAMFTGTFVDDYGIKYTISDTLWLQQPGTKFHIIKWNVKEQYLLARNDDKNPGEGGLYTRIDYMQFDNLKPWLWGYCLSVYDAKTDAIAEATAKADRSHPKQGCNGYPFSRMKRVE